MNISLEQVLALVGKLDDLPGDNTPRERFRQYLTSSVLKKVRHAEKYPWLVQATRKISAHDFEKLTR